MRNLPMAPSDVRSYALDGVAWRKSTRSQGQGADCVELARVAGVVGVRDSKDPEGPVLAVAPSVARVVAARIKRGQYDL
ncbi:DUF397 domain-containing protein [Actinomadura algeriensis]|uniref:DUF397 domain-containing protein n=1 Tax=Actinomadura algeriensis TaxID=1679523 RepID=A0ABR9JMX5_9ACTN|nr:DUF397 domain-containing protein [Actinomadura algeriensis]MBE1531892.1 hypothetical protein [Actinomadura algeriensis]